MEHLIAKEQKRLDRNLQSTLEEIQHVSACLETILNEGNLDWLATAQYGARLTKLEAQVAQYLACKHTLTALTDQKGGE